MDDKDIEDSASALLQLSNLHDLLCEKLRFAQTQSLLHFDKKDAKQEYSDAEINDQVKAAKQELISTQNENANRDGIAKLLLFGDEIFKSFYTKGESLVGEVTDDYYASLGLNIVEKLEVLDELNKDLLSSLNTMNQLEGQYEDSKKRLQDVEWKNRETAILLQNAERVCDVTQQREKAEEEHSKTRRLRDSLNQTLKELKLRKEVFQGLIHASKADWYRDEELSHLVVSLGEPIHLEDP